jgi:hypothetical protein
MAEPIHPTMPVGGTRRNWNDWLAGPMVFVALLFLVVLAGLIHRYPQLNANDTEAYLIVGALGVLWALLALEAIVRYWLLDRSEQSWKAWLATVAFALVPPLRMGRHGLGRADQIWLPVLGWREVDHRLRHTLERFFSIPLIGSKAERFVPNQPWLLPELHDPAHSWPIVSRASCSCRRQRSSQACCADWGSATRSGATEVDQDLRAFAHADEYSAN